MKVEIYKLMITESAMDMVHGFKREIHEIYIPFYRIAFNELDGVVHVFRPKKVQRYTNNEDCTFVREDRLDNAIVEAAWACFKSKAKLEKFNFSEFTGKRAA